MLLFVGLGNPTPNSENNRHNIGFKIKTWAGKNNWWVIPGSAGVVVLVLKAILGGKKTKGNPPLPGPPLPPGGN